MGGFQLFIIRKFLRLHSLKTFLILIARKSSNRTEMCKNTTFFAVLEKLLFHRLKMNRIEWVLTAISNAIWLGTAKICLLYASGLLF